MNARPSQICGELLAALDASEGRRRRRKRDTTPDAIGLTMKRELLERAVAADPDPDRFEQCLVAGASHSSKRSGSGSARRRMMPVPMKGPPPAVSEGNPCTSLHPPAS